jgi:hypothetical protein
MNGARSHGCIDKFRMRNSPNEAGCRVNLASNGIKHGDALRY